MSEQLKTIRLYIALPLLVTPFVTVMFWLMGGGKASLDATQKINGLNTKLPNAINVKDSSKDKLAFYELADADSIRRQEQISRDPYALTVDSIEKSHEVDQTIFEKKPNRFYPKTYPASLGVNETPIEGRGLPKIEQLSKLDEVDPDLEAIHKVLDKLAAIEQPTQVVANKEAITENIVGVLSGSQVEESFFGRKQTIKKSKRFLDEDTTLLNNQSFSACIPNAQVLEEGSMVKLQLNQAISVGAQQLPTGTFIYGLASLNNERLIVRIPSVRIANQIYTVALSIYDLDGIEGIYVPGSIKRDVIKSTAEQSLGSVNVLSLDPSIKTQAAIAGIGAAKNLLGKKVRTVRVRIAAGYKILLKENK